MTRFLFVGDVMNVHVMCFYWRYAVIGDTLWLVQTAVLLVGHLWGLAICCGFCAVF